MRLGMIGLGKMGKPMALNLLKAGHEVKVYNRSYGPVKALVQAGAAAAATPAEVGEGAEGVLLCLPVGKDVEEILCGQKGLLERLAAGSLVIDHSTIHPRDAVRMAEICHRRGVAYLDAPVSGGVTGAEQGTLSVMVGGEEGDYRRARPLLEAVGQNISYLGPSGSGNVMKLVNNLLVGITNSALAEAFVLAVKSGLNPEQVYDILSRATGDSVMLRRNLTKFVLPGNYEPAFTLNMLNKDMALAEDFALSQGVRFLLGSLAHQIGREAGFSGLGEKDMAVVMKYLADQSGVPFSKPE